MSYVSLHNAAVSICLNICCNVHAAQSPVMWMEVSQTVHHLTCYLTCPVLAHCHNLYPGQGHNKYRIIQTLNFVSWVSQSNSRYSDTHCK